MRVPAHGLRGICKSAEATLDALCIRTVKALDI